MAEPIDKIFYVAGYDVYRQWEYDKAGNKRPWYGLVTKGGNPPTNCSYRYLSTLFAFKAI